MRDARYFATELRKRIEALEDTEPSGRTRSSWQQAAALVGSVGRFVREQAVAENRRRETEARVARIRESLGR
jgi:hypothetical protein